MNILKYSFAFILGLLFIACKKEEMPFAEKNDDSQKKALLELQETNSHKSGLNFLDKTKYVSHYYATLYGRYYGSTNYDGATGAGIPDTVDLLEGFQLGCHGFAEFSNSNFSRDSVTGKMIGYLVCPGNADHGTFLASAECNLFQNDIQISAGWSLGHGNCGEGNYHSATFHGSRH